MKANSFNWGSGQIVHWELNGLDPNMALDQQLDFLREDLVQVRFARNILLDIGWYPEFSAEGAFVIMVVRDGNWDEPIQRQEARCLGDLRSAIDAGVHAAISASEE